MGQCVSSNAYNNTSSKDKKRVFKNNKRTNTNANTNVNTNNKTQNKSKSKTNGKFQYKSNQNVILTASLEQAKTSNPKNNKFYKDNVDTVDTQGQIPPQKKIIQKQDDFFEKNNKNKDQNKDKDSSPFIELSLNQISNINNKNLSFNQKQKQKQGFKCKLNKQYNSKAQIEDSGYTNKNNDDSRLGKSYFKEPRISIDEKNVDSQKFDFSLMQMNQIRFRFKNNNHNNINQSNQYQYQPLNSSCNTIKEDSINFKPNNLIINKLTKRQSQSQIGPVKPLRKKKRTFQTQFIPSRPLIDRVRPFLAMDDQQIKKYLSETK